MFWVITVIERGLSAAAGMAGIARPASAARTSEINDGVEVGASESLWVNELASQPDSTGWTSWAGFGLAPVRRPKPERDAIETANAQAALRWASREVYISLPS